MGLSTHYVTERNKREKLIKAIGIGEIVFKRTIYDTKREKNFIYEISSNAILTIRAFDEPTLIITRYPARPSRIKRYWNDAPEYIIQRAMVYEKNVEYRK